MLRAVIELSKYILAGDMLIYTLLSFLLVIKKEDKRPAWIFVIQDLLIFICHMTGSLVVLSANLSANYLFFSLIQMIALFSFLVLTRAIYPKSNWLILNHVTMLLSTGFVILTRISLQKSVRQFTIAVVAMIVALIIPYIMRHIHFIYHMEWLYAFLGLGILFAVLMADATTNGSKLSFSIGGISFQPSEFVKITYVFLIAIMLSKAKHFIQILISMVFAGAHVLILAASRDLGSALIYFIVYFAMLYIATEKFWYVILGAVGGAMAAVVGYTQFSHVRVRVEAWLDPWTNIDSSGYQIGQSLFAIGTGGWLGMGLDSGAPNTIPYVEQDFIFAAICEGFGNIFGICLIAVCFCLFWEMIKASKNCREPYYRYIATGLAVTYICQSMLTIGGNIKFILLTGVTLPLVSYGGSSMLASMVVFAIVQGVCVNSDKTLYDEDEDCEICEVYGFKGGNFTVALFGILFAAMAGYLAYYVEFNSIETINNSYNSKRQAILASQTIRGDIISGDGKVLATTSVENGEETRVYPYSNVFSHAIGYDTFGELGVEQMANIYLMSANLSLSSKLEDDLSDEKHYGNNVYTTFDTKLQQAAYDALGVYDGVVIVTEPTTGKILAMVSKPDFDPNEIAYIWEDLVDDDSSILLNRATQGLYPPGSTFKIMTAMEYIIENPDSYDDYEYTCNGSYTNGEYTIRCYHGSNHGDVDFTTSFAKSCNSSFSNIGLSLNQYRFAGLLDDLYFNQELPVDFTAKESTVDMDEDSDTHTVMQTVIGQGTTQMTPMHLAMITSMIANDGVMMKPYMIDHIENADGVTIKQYNPKSLGEKITSEEADILEELMIAVVEEGTATKLSGQEYKVAGKTGSAEYTSKADSHAWFTGYTYDTENPIQITVILEGAGSGGEYAAPVARRVLDAYYN